VEKILELIFNITLREDINKTVLLFFGFVLYFIYFKCSNLRKRHDKLEDEFKDYKSANNTENNECKRFCETHREKIVDDVKKEIDKKQDKFV